MNMSSNKETIEKFAKFCESEGISERRIGKYRLILGRLSEWLKVDFKEATREDIEGVVVKINQSDYADWTKSDHKKALKKFYKWLEGDGEECPKKVRWIKSGKITTSKIAEDMLSQEEIKKMIDNASNIRDKAIISLLYESGCRIGELLGLKIGSVVFKDTNLIHIHVSGKTGHRPIPLVHSIPYLSTWMGNHPQKNDSEANLFVSVGTVNKNKPIQYHAVSKMLRGVAKRSGVKKGVNPHNFRHSRASYLANKLKEPQMRMYFGWSKDSDMPATYVHLSGRDIDDAILEANGIKKPETDNERGVLASKTCPRCSVINEATATYCKNCMLPLDEKARMNFIEKMNNMGPIYNRIDELIEAKVREVIGSMVNQQT